MAVDRIIKQSELFAEGPTKKSIEYVWSLYDVRMKFCLRIFPAMATTLDEFEYKILKMMFLGHNIKLATE